MAAAAKSSISQSLIILLIVMTMWPVGNLTLTDMSHPALLSNGMESGKVCSNIDVRNTVENLEKKLRNCTVVEGFLQIVLIDIATAEYYENLTFPELREITGYLLLYRVQGLVSVAKLFPNLTVIRGSVLFHNYALVIFELRNLLDVGLKSLTVILRGSVRIEKNPLLCYVDTIDWDRIAKAGRGGHFIKENKNPATCPNTCPTDVECPMSSLSGGRQTKLCWNSNFCQKVCSPECEHLNQTCFSSGHHECCHSECLGSCSGTRSSECTACRHVIFDARCVKKCPTNTFEYLGRRCVKETECREINNQLVLQSTGPQIHWKPFKGQCLSECPPGHVEDEKDPHTCKECKGDCPKICLGGKINSVADAQKFKDCTYINGSLDIHVRGGSSIVKEFESSLGKIQEIRGYLKIARSYPLVSLNFLRDLNIIHGEYFDKRNYSFLVLDNQNLQELWNWENRKTKLKIKKGKIFFHFNSKLCLSKIEELSKYADIQPYDERDVSRTSNGDRATCNMKNILMEIHSLGPEVAVLKWQNFRKTNEQIDYRQLLGYLVYYREAPNGNVTMFDGQNACGSDVWKVVDVEPNEDDEMTEFTILPHLKPFTTYAAYIRTYTVSSAQVGGQSNITYFKTKPSTPSQPVNVRAHSSSHSEIAIFWEAPKNPNGDVSHYIVNGARVTDSSEYVRKRNYCSEPLPVTGLKQVTSDEKSSENDILLTSNGTSSLEKTEADQFCSCTDKKPRDSIEDETEYQIQFEDHLHNNIYFKNPNPVFRPRTNISRNATETTTPSSDSSTTTAVPDTPSVGTNITDSDETEITPSEPHNDSNRFYHVVKRLYLVVSHLHHFTEYNIEVKACQNRSSLSANERTGLPSPCSLQSLITIRTQALGNADDIDTSSLIINSDNLTSGTVFIKWDQPEDPNGLIVSYHIEYKPADATDYKPIPVCITQAEYEAKTGYSLHDLMPGNYSLRLRATSQAGNGNWTQPKYFVIPDTRGGMKQEILAVVVVAVCVALCLVVGVPVYFFYKRKYGLQIPNGILYASVNPEYMSAGLVYEPDEWEVPREKISVLEELGQGSFGMVYKGEAKNIDEKTPLIKCAVKTVNENASLRERIEFLQEASVMKAFNCHHVVKLLGVVSRDHPTLVIMELMANGDLKAFLRSRRPEANENTDIQPPTLRQILQMAIEIADGMAYLTAKKFVHRDLAARNCMVAEDMTVKIGDFGMTRDIYETDYYRKGGKGLLPVRWMAPECLKDGLFSSQSDVWSYGVVLWEMATLASQPYQGLSNEQVLKYVINGGCMEKPENCPEKLYALMKQCWEHDPRTRPTFTELIEILLPDVKNNKFREASFYFTQRAELSNHDNDESDDGALQSTPLRTRWGDNPNSRENSDDESEVQYFPSPRNTSSENRYSQNPHSNSSHNFIDIPPECQEAAPIASGGANCSRGYSIHSNDGSKGLSIPSSDSSKGSKASNYSNGSIVNGHVGAFVPGRTTRC